jgi:peptidoglycan/LPS O-acetylase OafA/YrhL
MRFRFIDGLRIFATAVVFVFHCAHVFDGIRFHVSNRETSMGYMLIVVFIIMWIMPLFFALSGASSQGSLKKRSAGLFVRERFLRLVIPYLMGIILLIPPQKYVDAVSHGQFHGSFREFLPWMWAHRTQTWMTPDLFGSFGHHLWFLMFLFIFSLLIIPAAAFFKTDKGQRILVKATGFLARPGLMRLAALPLLVYYPLVKPLAPGYSDWADFGFMFLFFITGFIINSSTALTERIRREWKVNLAVGLACFGILLVFLVRFGTQWFDTPGYNRISLSGYALWALGAWSIVFMFWGLGQDLFKRKIPLRLVQGSMPFYLIHQTVILLAAFFIVRWSMNIHLKFVLLLVTSFAGTLLLSEGLVTRFAVTRFLFGMPARKAARKMAEPIMVPASGQSPTG